MSNTALGLNIFLLTMLIHLSAQLPIHKRDINSQKVIDNSCPTSRINECQQSSNISCASLKEALIGYTKGIGYDIYLDTPYHVFSVFDLFYSGLLRGEDAPRATPIDTDVQSEITSKLWKSRCRNLLRQINLSKNQSNLCQWNYTCKYNPLYFPSFLIEAKLDESNSVKDKCLPLKVKSSKFVRTICQADPEESHWCNCEDQSSIIVGYKHSI